MKNEAVQKWIDALRSGKYKQGHMRLGNKNYGFCCLGVACQVAIEEGIINSMYSADADLVLYPAVMEWLGLRTPHGAYIDENDKNASLVRLNDGNSQTTPVLSGVEPAVPRASFNQIADVIEASPPGLFADDTDSEPCK